MVEEDNYYQRPGLAYWLFRWVGGAIAVLGFSWVFHKAFRSVLTGDFSALAFFSSLGFVIMLGAIVALFAVTAHAVFPFRLVSPQTAERLAQASAAYSRAGIGSLKAFFPLLDALATSGGEAAMTMLRLVWLLLKAMFGFYTPAVVVREGRLAQELLEGQYLGGGVAVVDLDSAVVLEQQWRKRFWIWWSPKKRRTGSSYKVTRVIGPGMTFIKWNEILRGVVSLRKQFRINIGVKACTSDGIEVTSNVFALFTLGQPIPVIKVAYAGAHRPENLRVIDLDESTSQIRAIKDELDDQDKAEIHRFATSLSPFSSPGQQKLIFDTSSESPPYELDDERILAAIYSQGRDVGDNQVVPWSDLPSLVATEVFRNLVAQVRYDDFYLPDVHDPNNHPLYKVYRPAFVNIMRYLGVMSYQFILRRDGRELQVNQEVKNRTCYISPVQKLTGFKVLRDRGIKVIHVGFTDLKPAEEVQKQRLDNWQARWQQKAARVRADTQREVTQIIAQARADKQREMILNLSQIMQTTSLSEEALTLRVLQVLEDAASDPATRQFLPGGTIDLLRNLQMWLLPDENMMAAMLEDNLRYSRWGR